ncbi:MAG: hypothetical protein ABI969_19785 [bacterium]
MRAIRRNTKARRPSDKRPVQPIRVEVRELDPLRKCGLGTTVQRLYRVIERADGVVINHLVFLDRHGWYCEHGRACPAVSMARKQPARRTSRSVGGV